MAALHYPCIKVQCNITQLVLTWSSDSNAQNSCEVLASGSNPWSVPHLLSEARNLRSRIIFCPYDVTESLNVIDSPGASEVIFNVAESNFHTPPLVSSSIVFSCSDLGFRPSNKLHDANAKHGKKIKAYFLAFMFYLFLLFDNSKFLSLCAQGNNH